MSSTNAVGSLGPGNFGSFVIAQARGASLDANSVVVMPILSGGLTTSGSDATSGSVIARSITVRNQNMDVSAANVTFGLDSNVAVPLTALTTLSNLSSGTEPQYQDVAIIAPFVPANGSVISGNVTNAIYMQVNNGVANGTVDVVVYGDVVNP